MMNTNGAEMIKQERIRQINVEGWTAVHDSQWINGELVDAAITYLFGQHTIYGANRKPLMWPWAPKWYKPKDRIRDLVRAGALVAAEIDRLVGDSIEFDFGSPHGEIPPEEGPEVEIARLKAETEKDAAMLKWLIDNEHLPLDVYAMAERYVAEGVE